ncbi:MAG: iron-sulfur cluster assembly accessory protein [Alphaproteobacteria bacterium]|nr:iron-sulfur cluster assembly accessory protein [Alphaproteobacteria bacterium]
MSLIITENAKNRINAIREKRGDEKLRLRITVEGGGCSGFQYKLSFDSALSEEDTVFDETVVTDTTSLPLLNDSTVDFESGLMGEDFVIKNPNASSSCGCGTSFAV